MLLLAYSSSFDILTFLLQIFVTKYFGEAVLRPPHANSPAAPWATVFLFSRS